MSFSCELALETDRLFQTCSDREYTDLFPARNGQKHLSKIERAPTKSSRLIRYEILAVADRLAAATST
jgi:hypothetical protein